MSEFPCPYGCGKEIGPGNDLKNHIDDCPNRNADGTVFPPKISPEEPKSDDDEPSS